MFAGRIAQFNNTYEDVKTWLDLLDPTITSPSAEKRKSLSVQ
jgi:hypothetical protein